MKTKGIVTTQNITDYKNSHGGYFKLPKLEANELSLKEMLISCFAYDSIEDDYKNYIEPYKTKLGSKIFDEVYNEMCEHFKKCKVVYGVYTDSEDCTYNTIVEV
jgi:hypothetical protein